MGIFDEAKEMAGKAKVLAEEHADQVKAGVAKAADFVDEKTGDKYKDKLDKGEQFINDKLGKGDDPKS
jgi:hypothetical protein